MTAIKSDDSGVKHFESSVTGEREISSTRVLDAPRELVWKVWTDPKHIEKWWGTDRIYYDNKRV